MEDPVDEEEAGGKVHHHGIGFVFAANRVEGWPGSHDCHDYIYAVHSEEVKLGPLA